MRSVNLFLFMNSKLVVTLESAAWPALLVDESGVIRATNDAGVRLFGPAVEGEPGLGASVWSPENDSSPELFLSRLKRTPVSVAPLKFKVKGGGTDRFRVYIAPVQRDGTRCHLLQLFPDASQPAPPPKPAAAPEPKPVPAATANAEAVQAQKQKLDCALQLTRTVALDFNNALTSVLGHTSLLLGKMESDHPWRGSLLEVEKSAEKAAEIAHDLAAFSRQEKDQKTQISGNLNDLLRRSVELFRPPAFEDRSWALRFEKKIYTARFDEGKMQQACVKLLENAMQATQAGSTITVTTRNHSLSKPLQEGTLRLAPGHYVCIEIDDSGEGIPQDVLPRIFEPFFTTRKSPPHRGLGLAWVYGIVTNHGGSVKVDSEPGVGTAVRIYLPAEKKIVREDSIAAEDLTGRQTILMVDDEDLLLTMGQTILSAFGYKVLTANNGLHALEVYRQNPKQIDLVITDMVMPGMSGRELMGNLLKLDPAMRIICTTGYVRSPQKDGEPDYLLKPFSSQDLLRKVKRALQPENAGR